MAWYSYFLMSVPEVFVMTMLSFVFFGIQIRGKLRKMIVDACIRGAVAFSASVYWDGALKPIITIVIGVLVITIIYRFKWSYGFLLSFFALVFVSIFEIIAIMGIVPLLGWEIKEILTNPMLRIGTSYIVMIMLIFVTYVAYKLNIRWNIAEKISR